MRFTDWLEKQREEAEGDWEYPGFIHDAYDDDEFLVIEKEHVGESRWYQEYVVTFKHRTNDEYWQFEFRDPSTEMQEFYWEECIGEPYQVVPQEETVIRYVRIAS